MVQLYAQLVVECKECLHETEAVKWLKGFPGGSDRKKKKKNPLQHKRPGFDP